MGVWGIYLFDNLSFGFGLRVYRESWEFRLRGLDVEVTLDLREELGRALGCKVPILNSQP